MERNQVRTSGNVLLIISLVSTLPNYFPFKIHLKYPIFFSEPGCGRATPARSPTRWEYPICRFCSRGASLLVHPPSFIAHHLLHIDETGAQLPRESVIMYRPPSPHPKASPEGAKPPRTPAVVLRPLFLRVCCGKGAQHPLTFTRTKGEPSSTPTVVYRPPPPWGTGSNLFKWDFLDVLWFRVLDSSDVNIITLNSRKYPRKHEKRKISWVLIHIVPSPVPQHQNPQIRKPSVCSAEIAGCAVNPPTKITKRGTGAEQ